VRFMWSWWLADSDPPFSPGASVQRDAGSGYAGSVGIGRRGKAADLHARFDFLGRRTPGVAKGAYRGRHDLDVSGMMM
jgi:hypothetical protein